VLSAIEGRIVSTTGATVLQGIVLTTVTVVGADGVATVVESSRLALPVWLIVVIAVGGFAVCACFACATVAVVLYSHKRALSSKVGAAGPRAAAVGVGERKAERTLADGAPVAATTAAQAAPAPLPARAPSTLERVGTWMQGAFPVVATAPPLPVAVGVPVATATVVGVIARNVNEGGLGSAAGGSDPRLSKRAHAQPPTGRPAPPDAQA
jgi:hypothetical protein